VISASASIAFLLKNHRNVLAPEGTPVLAEPIAFVRHFGLRIEVGLAGPGESDRISGSFA